MLVDESEPGGDPMREQALGSQEGVTRWEDKNRRAGCVLLSFNGPTLPCPKTSVTTSGAWLRIDSPLV